MYIDEHICVPGIIINNITLFAVPFKKTKVLKNLYTYTTDTVWTRTCTACIASYHHYLHKSFGYYCYQVSTYQTHNHYVKGNNFTLLTRSFHI